MAVKRNCAIMSVDGYVHKVNVDTYVDANPFMKLAYETVLLREAVPQQQPGEGGGGDGGMFREGSPLRLLYQACAYRNWCWWLRELVKLNGVRRGDTKELVTLGDVASIGVELERLPWYCLELAGAALHNEEVEYAGPEDPVFVQLRFLRTRNGYKHVQLYFKSQSWKNLVSRAGVAGVDTVGYRRSCPVSELSIGLGFGAASGALEDLYLQHRASSDGRHVRVRPREREERMIVCHAFCGHKKVHGTVRAHGLCFNCRHMYHGNRMTNQIDRVCQNHASEYVPMRLFTRNDTFSQRDAQLQPSAEECMPLAEQDMSAL